MASILTASEAGMSGAATPCALVPRHRRQNVQTGGGMVVRQSNQG